MNTRRLVVAALVSTVIHLIVPDWAWAHIVLDPTEAQAGSSLSLGFTVEHGCGGSPTVGLNIQFPNGVTDPVLEPPPAGWSGTVDGGGVTLEGGPQPDQQPMTFRVRMTLPPTPDTRIYFPVVQRCEGSIEVRPLREEAPA